MEELEKLYEERKTAFKAFKANEEETAEAIKSCIVSRCSPEGVTPIIHLEMDTPWRRGKDSYRFSGKISFATDDEKRLAKGFKSDFGSDFDIRIHDVTGITINKGTIGEYGLNDKYQIARDKMIASIWENHDTIVEVMNNRFKFELYQTLKDLDNKIYDIELDIKNAEEARKREKALNTLKLSKYIAKLSINDIYENDDWYTRKVIGKKYRYYDIFTIEKVTEKCVIGYEQGYRFSKKRLNLEQVLYSIMIGSKICFVEEPKDYEVLNEDVPGQLD